MYLNIKAVNSLLFSILMSYITTSDHWLNFHICSNYYLTIGKFTIRHNMYYITLSRSDCAVNDQCQQSNHIAIWTSVAVSRKQKWGSSRIVIQTLLMVPDYTVLQQLTRVPVGVKNHLVAMQFGGSTEIVHVAGVKI